MRTNIVKLRLFFGIAVFFLAFPLLVKADYFGEQRSFFIQASYDKFQRERISATLKKIGDRAYFYVDNNWWKSLDYQGQARVRQSLQNLSQEFSNKIYPILTATYGSEWKPGIDKDKRITILIHQMKKEDGGYFNSGDEYPRARDPRSNQREMIYLNAEYVTSTLAKSYLAHEFTHLITFNQKDRIGGVQEEVWLNEARADYSPTLMGYDSDYEGSNLQRRVKTFLSHPADSITEWQGKKDDYGALSLFTHYLVEKYGIAILVDSLKSKSTGIKSLNEALQKNGFEEDFSQIFTDWTITVLVNDCSLGEKYCYLDKNLKKLKIVPSINFLPLNGKSTLGVNQTTKNWSGNWFKFIGGKGTLKINFIGNPENLFKVPYVTKDISGKYSLGFFHLNEYQRGEILIPGFGSKIVSVSIIPSIQSKTSGFTNPEPGFPYFWEASTVFEMKEIKADADQKYLDRPIQKMGKEEILAKISEIEKLLSQLKEQLSKIEKKEAMEEISCKQFDNDLFYGLRNDDRVRCLQEFLKAQGSEIYPEGLITGNFLSLTRKAVIRFQEKYADDILSPLGLKRGTGYVGPSTRAKINQLLENL